MHMTEERIDDGIAPATEPTLREVISSAVESQKSAQSEAPAPASAPVADPAKAPIAPETDEAKAARLREADGRFAKAPETSPEAARAPVDPATPALDAAKDAATAHRPPPGFSVASKAAWDALPESVKSDIAKREAEVDAGFKRYSGLGKYAQEAEKHGTSLQAAVDDYFSIENGLRKDFIGGMEAICKRFGYDPRALHTAMGRRYGLAPDQAPQQERQMAPQIDPRQIAQQVRAEIQAEMETESINRSISEFSADPKNRYFDNVKQDMGLLLKSGKATTLREAYDAACWLNPEIRGLLLKEQPAAAPNRSTAADQARAAAKAVGGAPSSGFNPDGKPAYNPNETTRETIIAAVRAQKARV